MSVGFSTNSYNNSMVDIAVSWFQIALTYFWSHGRTKKEKSHQDSIVKDYAANVDGTRSAKIVYVYCSLTILSTS